MEQNSTDSDWPSEPKYDSNPLSITTPSCLAPRMRYSGSNQIINSNTDMLPPKIYDAGPVVEGITQKHCISNSATANPIIETRTVRDSIPLGTASHRYINSSSSSLLYNTDLPQRSSSRNRERDLCKILEQVSHLALDVEDIDNSNTTPLLPHPSKHTQLHCTRMGSGQQKSVYDEKQHQHHVREGNSVLQPLKTPRNTHPPPSINCKRDLMSSWETQDSVSEKLDCGTSLTGLLGMGKRVRRSGSQASLIRNAPQLPMSPDLSVSSSTDGRGNRRSQYRFPPPCISPTVGIIVSHVNAVEAVLEPPESLSDDDLVNVFLANQTYEQGQNIFEHNYSPRSNEDWDSNEEGDSSGQLRTCQRVPPPPLPLMATPELLLEARQEGRIIARAAKILKMRTNKEASIATDELPEAPNSCLIPSPSSNH